MSPHQCGRPHGALAVSGSSGRRWLRRVLAALAVLALVVAVVGYLALPQIIPSAILYAPNTGKKIDPAGDRASLRQKNARHLRLAVGPPSASLSVLVFPPSSGAVPRGTILVFHGIHDSKQSQLGTGAYLASEGYRAVLVDLRGHGRSSGGLLTYGVRESSDAIQLLDHLQREELLALPVGALGFSYGGAVALQLAARDRRVRAVVSVATFSSLRGVLRDYVAYQVPLLGRVLPTDAQLHQALAEAGRLAKFDPDAADNVQAAATTTARVLIVHGQGDAKIPPSHARRIARAAGDRARLVLVPGEDHDSVFGDRQGLVRREMIRWFSRWLRP